MGRAGGHQQPVAWRDREGVALRCGQQAAYDKTAAQVFVVGFEQGGGVHATRSTLVVISVATVVMSLCTGHFVATASSSCSWASLSAPRICSVALS